MNPFAPIRSTLICSLLALSLSSTAFAGDWAVAAQDPQPVDDDDETVLDCGTSNEWVYENELRRSVSVKIRFESTCTGGGGLDLFNRDGSSDALVYLTVPGQTTVLTEIDPGSYLTAACGIADGDKGCCTLEITELGIAAR